MEITDFIENYKSLPPTNTQQIISYLLKNGKLTIEEIAECLNLPVNQIAQKQLEIQ